MSGDFFWVHEREEYGIVMVADCPGHDFPSAFLSILGVSLLKELLHQETSPLNAVNLLNRLHEKLVGLLHENNTKETTERLDMGLCIFNYPGYNLQFAGTNQSLHVVRNNKLKMATPYDDKINSDKRTLYTFNGSKNVTGNENDPLSLENYDIEFYTDDTLYMFSDGFTRQLAENGSPRFSLNAFKTGLLQIQDMPMPVQKDYLDNMFIEWKGNSIHADDMLMLGIRM